MCLKHLKPAPRRAITRGYVVVCPLTGGYKTGVFWRRSRYRTRVWETDQRGGILRLFLSSEGYSAGFHVFTTERNAVQFWNRRRSYTELWECDIKDIVAYGKQWNYNVVVAKQRRLTKCLRRKRKRRAT